MRILQINTVYKHGGSTGKIVHQLHKSLYIEGIDSYVAYGYDYEYFDEENTYRIENIPELKLSILKTRIDGKHGFYNKSSTEKLVRWIDKIKPDIIHLHNLHNHYLNVEILFQYIKEKAIPVVWTLHDCWPFTGWCAYFDFADCNRWKTQCYNCPCLKDYPKTWFFDRSEQNYKRKKEAFLGAKNLVLVTPSQWLADLTRESFLCEYPVRVIRNGINLDIFNDYSENIDISRYIPSNEHRKILLGVANSWSRRKGFDDFLELNRVIDHRFYVIALVGINQKQMKKLPKNMYGILRTENIQQLVALYKKSFAFLNFTYEDNYPTTNLEALASGVPVITYRTGGSPEAIDPSIGFVVEKKDWHMIITALEQLGNNYNVYRQNSINYAKKFFKKENSFEEYLKLYKSIYETKCN